MPHGNADLEQGKKVLEKRSNNVHEDVIESRGKVKDYFNSRKWAK